MKKIVLITLLSIFAVSAFAQRANQKWFNKAIGVRAELAPGLYYPDMMGVTFEKFTFTRTSIEGFVTTNFTHAFHLGCMYKYVASLPNVPSFLRWYFGGGPHFGMKHIFNNNSDPYNITKCTVYGGIVGVLGIGYTFDEFPLNLNIDYQPLLAFSNIKKSYKNTQEGIPILEMYSFGLSIRYIIE